MSVCEVKMILKQELKELDEKISKVYKGHRIAWSLFEWKFPVIFSCCNSQLCTEIGNVRLINNELTIIVQHRWVT